MCKLLIQSIMILRHGIRGSESFPIMFMTVDVKGSP